MFDISSKGWAGGEPNETLRWASASAGEIEAMTHSPVHEAEGQERGDAVRGYHEHDSNDLALLPGLHEV